MQRTPWSLLRTVLRRTAPAGDTDPPPDAVLLDRFVRSRDEAAFELLLWRHANLVLGVCRRIVRDDHLAEDAFQATFLVLARKAGSLRNSASVAGWLHRVARRVAVRAMKKRVRHETPLPHDPAAPDTPSSECDLQTVIDQEIDRLPDRYRLPVVLCYVQEHTTEDVARLLGVPRGTVLSRLATAREKLSRRLTRRGVTVPAVGLFAVGTGAATADELVQSTFRAAVAFATGGRAATTSVILATEVLRMSAWKTTTGLALAITLTAGLGTGVGIVASERTTPADPAPASAGQAESRKPAPARDEAGAKDRTAQRERQLQVLNERSQELGRTIAELRDRRLADGRADEVDVAVLRAQLIRHDEQILADEASLTGSEAAVRYANQNFDNRDKYRPDARTIEDMVSRYSSVVEARGAVEKLKLQLSELARKVGGDSPQMKSAQADLKDAEATLFRVQTEARESAVKQWQAESDKKLRSNLDEAKQRYESAILELETHRKQRTQLVKRIADARAVEDAALLIEDELRVYRELRQQILRQRLVLQLEQDGITLPDAGRPQPADTRVGDLMREIEDLKAEVRQLKRKKDDK
jgi:RNA polymerase sigma factor (sigma-70 family)